MPSKNKRAALRQAKLSQRRRRRGVGRRQKTTEPTEASTAASSIRRRANLPAASATSRVQTPMNAATTTTEAQRPRSVATAPRARTRAAQNRAATLEPLPMYAYLGSELRRIGAVAAVMALALAGLTVVLG